MLNYLWSFMILFSCFIAGFGGHMPELTQGVLEHSQSAVELAFKMCGVLAMWMGIMQIAEKSLLIDVLAERMTPLLNFLFPNIPPNHPSRKYIATNIIANFLGLGWAATPPGLRAMEELQKLNPHPRIATHDMCMFLIINISSVQLIPINMITYRASCGSLHPTEIIAPSIIATTASTLIAICFAKLMYGKERR